MIIVPGHLVVDATEREAYLAGSAAVVWLARETEGCLDFALTADLLDARRINVFERWTSLEALEAFRGDGPSDEQGAAIIDASVVEYAVTGERSTVGPAAAR